MIVPSDRNAGCTGPASLKDELWQSLRRGAVNDAPSRYAAKTPDRTGKRLRSGAARGN